MTGYKKATIYKLIYERKIPFHKPAHGGRRVFFKSAEIDKWLQANRIETNEEFFLKHRENKKVETNNKAQFQRKLQALKSLLFIFTTFQNVIQKYKTQIQKLEEKVAKYESDNWMIENLFIDEFINTSKDENE
jgi:excisionase family DNA binding protein